MALLDKLKSLVGRPRKQPARESEIYPRLMSLGTIGMQKDRPLIKPTPSNLRLFSRSPWARRAINAVKNPIAVLEWSIQPRKDATASAELDRQIEVATACFSHPNQDDSFRKFLEKLIEDILGFGAATYEQEVGADQLRPLWMWPVDSQSIQIYPAWSGKRNEARYLQTQGFGNIGGVQGIQLLDEELVFIQTDPSTATPFSYGPLEYAFSTINRLLGTEDYAGNVASNAQPQNIIQIKGIDSDKIQAFRNFWRDEVEGQGQTPLINGDDLKVAALRGNNDAALYLEYQEWLVRTIAACFCISPLRMGLERDVNRNTGEVAEDQDWDNMIKPLAMLFAAEFTSQTLHRRLGFYQLEFAFHGLEREDELATAEIYEIHYKNNLVTPNEHRARLGMEPSDSQWADMTAADVEVAMNAARGMGQDLDRDLPGDPAQKQPKTKK